MDPKATAKTAEHRPCTECGRLNSFEARFCGACGNELVSESQALGNEVMADPLIGRIIADRYRILQFLGRGGMGVVYRVEHVHIGKVMAMKLLHGELARDRDTIKRFRREAEAASKLSHPNTVQVFDFGSSQGLMYLVMEYVDGRDLGQVIRDAGTLDFARVARLTAQVCGSVAEAHRLGIVHRDIKPENVMIVTRPDQGETAKVLDFGLAKLRDTQAGNTVTRAGAIVGTPYYMPPEQIRGEDVDPRGDVYAIGAMMYKAVTGAPPFVAASPMGVLTKHLTEALTPPSHKLAKVPPEADVIIGRAMEKEARDRYPDADALRAALADYLGLVGHDMTDPSLALESRELSSSGRRKVAQLATRGDVDRFEHRLQRRGLFAYTVGVLAVAALITVGVVYGRRYLATLAPPTEESEPNDTPETASRILRDGVLSAHLGQRVSETEGDVDFYRIVRRGQGREHLDVVASGVPNVDMILELVRVGGRVPAIEVNAGGVGEGESLIAFPVLGRRLPHPGAPARGRGRAARRERERPVQHRVAGERARAGSRARAQRLARDGRAGPADGNGARAHRLARRRGPLLRGHVGRPRGRARERHPGPRSGAARGAAGRAVQLEDRRRGRGERREREGPAGARWADLLRGVGGHERERHGLGQPLRDVRSRGLRGGGRWLTSLCARQHAVRSRSASPSPACWPAPRGWASGPWRMRGP
jgi:tRNA A-37 threonylcarbamoyl transferase component Bud32